MIGRTDDIDACRRIRHSVFVIEQGVPEAEEWDDLDAQAIHLIAHGPDGTAIGTARILLAGDTGKIGRVAVLKPGRGAGIGAGLISAALEELRALPGISRAKLGAQLHAIGFYEKLGFHAYGPEYDDAGIPHRDMMREIG